MADSTTSSSAYISVTSTSETSITVRLSGLDENYASSDRTVTWYVRASGASSWTDKGSVSLGANISSGGRKTLSGLSTGTEYEIRAYITNTAGTLQVNLYESAATDESQRPDYFSWTTAKTAGGVFNLTASEWNALTENINEVREYKGEASYAFTAAATGEEFTAAMYNQARSAIRGMGSGWGDYIPSVSKGDKITAQQLNVLVSELNAIS